VPNCSTVHACELVPCTIGCLLTPIKYCRWWHHNIPLRPPTDGCTTVHCFCKEFLLKPGDYQNPFDSTHSTGIRCDFRKEGWYGGMIRCIGGYFDPYKRRCISITAASTAAMLKIPVRREFHVTTCCTQCALVQHCDVPGGLWWGDLNQC
jgi:hypothetical protein